ncbi:hypothetical protein LNQ81_04160 [Myroides sp. M-43]|uniref:hypothetical protein n=1 Tax=Myroides oncorhynchi TaxID=2893756 RepID=UPI001E6085C4|nr:hypothetical protein [Myroides oncorhynchi]MCC9041895.1 hypothetical protein [Myroides oncorhynchi]
MKKIVFSALAALAFVGVSCSSDDNGNIIATDPVVVIKNIKNIDVVLFEEGKRELEKKFDLYYTEEGKLTTIEYTDLDEEGTVYENSKGNLTQDSKNKLEKISSPKEMILIKDLLVYQNSAYKVGKVLKYDNHKNPSEILVYNRDMEEITMKISYDDKPFFGFHTLRAAGIIDLLDGIELNLANPTVPAELKLAKELLPRNNPITYTYTNKEGIVLDNIKIVYAYDESNYPTKAVLTGTRQMSIPNYVNGVYVNQWESYDFEVVTSYSYVK